MEDRSKGHSLFIVDNSVSGWTGHRYLLEWTAISKAFDIATGYFEIGALLSLDSNWQRLEKIRILMGAETSKRTKKALLEAVRNNAIEKLDGSIEKTKDTNPFLKGVESILSALKSGQIECRVYTKGKFHAKAYITHAKLEVVGSQALVGSSNFTAPGLTQNIELNVQVQSAREVEQLQEWYEIHWNEAESINDELVETVHKHVRQYSPFEVYAKSLHEFFKGHELTATEWDEQVSRMFPVLDRYQQEAYWALMKIARQHGGAFLCDGVGLGKTFVGLMLIERLILHDSKRVVLFAPKAAKEGVWEPHLREWLPHIGGVGGNADFSNLAVFSHTDLGRKGDYPERFKRMTELADVVIIDEAHHFRNPGRKGDPRQGIEPSRYHVLYDMLSSEARKKTLFMLTATPINNRLSDFRHMIELFTRKDDRFFARTLGVNNLRSHFIKMEHQIEKAIGHDVVDAFDQFEEIQEFISADQIFKHLVVQRSRSYAKESQMREKGTSAAFPTRNAPKVAEYSIRKTYSKFLDLFEKAFSKKKPLFTLPMYYPLAWYIGSDVDIDPLEEGRQKQVVGLIRTNFLKRFESSVVAFELSCERLLQKLLAFAQVHSETDSEKKRLERWKEQKLEILNYATQRHLEFWGDDGNTEEEDIVPEELLNEVEHLDRKEYNVPEMLAETYLDLDQIVEFIVETRRVDPQHDDKLKKLIRLLKTKGLKGKKVLVFTEFADTARYLARQLQAVGISGVTEIDSNTKTNRSEIIQRFAPYYNGLSDAALKEKGWKPIDILISTDVLSEGLNLQDASNLINYDIHWNPVRLMQRIGRVDRRMNPAVEERMIEDNPQIEEVRGKVNFWNFLPPSELNALLSLYTRVTQKTLLISKTLGIEGKQLLTPEDDYEALKEFNSAYEGSKTMIEEMHLEYQSLISEDAELEKRLDKLPGAVFSGRLKHKNRQEGVFFCYALPAMDRETEEFTIEAGTTRWYFYDMQQDSIVEEAGDIVQDIRSNPKTPLRTSFNEDDLIDIRKKVEKHIKNTYLKRMDAPLGAKPKLNCWMELNEVKS